HDCFDSVTDFNCDNPFSNSPPSILSWLMIRQKILPTKLFSPNMLHVTCVPSPCGLKVNSAVLSPLNGWTNFSAMRIKSLGLHSLSVIEPSPTLLLPFHPITAPTSPCVPSNVLFALGSSFAHGDQVSHLRKSRTLSNTFAGGAEIVVDRDTRKSL